MSDQLATVLEAARGRLQGLGSGWELRRSGSGGQTVSCRAESDGGEVVCVKCALPGSVHLRREAQMLGRLESRHFPRLIFDGSSEGFVIEEHVDGDPLNALPRQNLWRLLSAIAAAFESALAALHSGFPAILHRDIKPANLRLAGERLVLLDFGSAELEGQRDPETPSGARAKVGGRTHLFQPPEQLVGSPLQDRRVDVFAAAGVLFAILTGRAPYRNDERDPEALLASYRQVQRGLRRQLAGYPDRVADRLIEALRVTPEDRPSSLHSLAEAISEYEWA